MISDAGYTEAALFATPEGRPTFFDLAAFPWVREVETRWTGMCAELAARVPRNDGQPLRASDANAY